MSRLSGTVDAAPAKKLFLFARSAKQIRAKSRFFALQCKEFQKCSTPDADKQQCLFLRCQSQLDVNLKY
jgi:hypothetical protein